MNSTVYLKFNSEEEWRDVALAAGVLRIEDEKEYWSCYTPEWAIDVVGVITDPGTYDEEGNELTPPVPHDGYHVNAKFLKELPVSFGIRTVNPATPRRIFLGD